MRVLIFGATGSVGVHTALHLSSCGHDVIALGKRQSDGGFFADKGIPYYSVDIKDKSSFDIIPGSFDAVVHFAGAMPARMNGYNPYEYIDSIITGTLNVLEFMMERDCGKIIFAQSISDILYRFGTTVPIEDDAQRKFPLNSDHSVYSISKNAAVNLIEHYHAKYGIKRFILRLPTIYVYHPNPYYYVDGKKQIMGYRHIINEAVKGNTLEVWGDPSSKKEMVYVKDFAQMVRLAVESQLDGGIYNVGCGEPVSIEEQIKTIADVFQTKTKSDIVFRPEKKSSPQFVLDITKAERDLGYKPQFGFRDMMIDFRAEMEAEPFAALWGRKEDY